jgi:iron-sulfur cluster assembly accessory protein
MTLKKTSIQVSDLALEQLALILSNDHTVKGNVFRLIIDSKGCSGFRYHAGFTVAHIDDTLIEVIHNDQIITLALDPFSSHYMQDIKLDFVQDFENNQEGFVIINNNETKHQGKFWENDPTLIPSHITAKHQGL